MDELLFPEDIAARYHVALKTAKKYMRMMRHRTCPLAVTPEAVKEWDDSRTIEPSDPKGKPVQKPVRSPKQKLPDSGKFLISRVRPSA